jgi:hypothetical protein
MAEQRDLPPAPEESGAPFVIWAEAELRRAGLFDKDSDYEGMIGESVMKLVKAFSGEGHSGYSAHLAASIFARLSDWKPLTPLTDAPDEWNHIEEAMAGRPDCWQNARRPDAFSNDGGKTYYLLDERQPWPRRALRRLGVDRPKMHLSAAAAR